jgi:hypothetical protein
MKISPKKTRKVIHHKEIFTCKQCKKKWEVSWMEVRNGKTIEHAVTCACSKVLKTVQTAPEGPPVMIPQHSKDNTFAACMPAAVAGALFPILSDAILLAVYVLSWIACGANFVNDDNRNASALGGIAIQSLLYISFAASIGALVGHALWWWWQ